MRTLIVILLLMGGAAAIFYEANVAHDPQRRLEPTSAASRALGTDDVDKHANQGEAAQSLSNDTKPLDPLGDDDLSPSESWRPKPDRDPAGQTDLSQDGQKSGEDRSRHINLRPRALPHWFSAMLSLDRLKVRRASDDLAAARKQLETVQSQRSDLAGQVSKLGSDALKLRASMQAQSDEVINLRGQLADRAAKATFATDRDRVVLQNQIASLQSKADEAATRKQEAENKLSRAEALAGTLQTKLSELDAASRQTTSQARSKLAVGDAAASRYKADMAKALEELRLTKIKVRDLTAYRDAATARTVKSMAQLHLANAGLLAKRVALAKASERAAADQRAATDNARRLEAGNEALRIRSQAAAVQIDEMKRASARATRTSADMQGQVRDLKVRSESAEVALTAAHGQNTDLKARLDAASADARQKIADLRQENETLAGQAGRVLQLAQELDKGRKQQDILEGMVATLTAQNKEQADRMDSMREAEQGQSTESKAAADRNNASMAEATQKLRVAEAKVRDLTAERDAATARTTDIMTRQRMTSAGLSATRLALAGATARTAAAEHASGSTSDHARRLIEDNETLRRRSETADTQIEKLKDALSRVTTAAAITRTQSQGLESRRASAEAELTDARAANGKLAARLDVATSDYNLQLTELRQCNATLASAAAKLPQLERNIEDGESQLDALKKTIVALRSESGGQRVRIDALTKTSNSSKDRLSQVESDHKATMVVADEHTKKLDKELASVRDKLAQAVKDKDISIDARRSTEQALIDTKAKLLTERRRVALLNERPMEAGGPKPRATKSVGPQSDSTVENKETVRQAPPPASIPASSIRSVVRPVLPNAVARHVLLHYAHNKARSQSRAQALEATLRGLGIDVEGSAGAGSGKADDTVTYYYVQDRGIADQVAQQINAPAPTRSLGGGNQLHRPGTIEISVGG